MGFCYDVKIFLLYQRLVSVKSFFSPQAQLTTEQTPIEFCLNVKLNLQSGTVLLEALSLPSLQVLLCSLTHSLSVVISDGASSNETLLNGI
jgi:hypothetical protein